MPSRIDAHSKKIYFYSLRLQTIETLFKSGRDDRETSLVGFTLELENIRACLGFLEQESDSSQNLQLIGLGVRLLLSSTEALAYWLPSQEQINWNQTGMCFARQIGNRDAEFHFTHNLALLFISSGNLKQALQLLNQNALMPENRENKLSLLRTYNSLGRAYIQLGQLELASHILNQALQLADEIADPSEMSYVMANMGVIYHRQGFWKEAFDAYNFALDVARLSKDRNSESKALEHIGDLFFERGKYIKAKQYFERALEIAKEEMDSELLDAALQGLGNVAFMQKKYDVARYYYTTCHTNAKDTGRIMEQAVAIGNIGNIYFRMGYLDIALKYYEDQLRLIEKFSISEQSGRVYANIGLTYFNLRELAKSRDYISKAREFFQQTDIETPTNLKILLTILLLSNSQTLKILFRVLGFYFKLQRFIYRKYQV